ncbi:MAG: BspA family leucine-rich repeat surface protein [Corynebacterium sp.]|nr:BspA family leucine-rich repeat surface protein [Corynebacterium sp.]
MLPLSTTTPLFSELLPVAAADSQSIDLGEAQGSVTATSTDGRNYVLSGTGTIDNQKFRELILKLNSTSDPSATSITFGPGLSLPEDSSNLFLEYHTMEEFINGTVRSFFLPYKGDIRGTELLNTSAVKNMSNLLFGIKGNPDVSTWDTSNVTNMSGMFNSAANANPDVSKWDTSKVTNMDSMFVDADSADPNVAAWNTRSLVSARKMFCGTDVANPDVSKWDTHALQSAKDMFANAVSAYPDFRSWPDNQGKREAEASTVYKDYDPDQHKDQPGANTDTGNTGNSGNSGNTGNSGAAGSGSESQSQGQNSTQKQGDNASTPKASDNTAAPSKGLGTLGIIAIILLILGGIGAAAMAVLPH